MAKTVAFRDLMHLLEDKGFKQTIVGRSHRLFINESAGAEVIMPFRTPPARALPIYASLVRVTLDQRGLMEQEDFNEWMFAKIRASKLATNGSAKSRTHAKSA